MGHLPSNQLVFADVCPAPRHVAGPATRNGSATGLEFHLTWKSYALVQARASDPPDWMRTADARAQTRQVPQPSSRSYSFKTSREITIFWISLVPSPISVIFASRIIRSTGYSRE